MSCVHSSCSATTINTDVKSNKFYNYYDRYFEFNTNFVEIWNKCSSKSVEFLLVNSSKYSWATFIDNIIKFLKKRNKELEGDTIMTLSQKYEMSMVEEGVPMLTEYNDKVIELSDNILKVQVLNAWKRCTLCRVLFSKASKLMVYNNENYSKDSIMFNDGDYPIEMVDAISKLRMFVKNSKLENEIVFGLYKSGSSKIAPIYSGIEEDGSFEHIRYIRPTEATMREGKMLEINTILKDSLIKFIQITRQWIPHTNALECIDNAYSSKGSSAPGYSHYASAVKWFVVFVKNLKNINNDEHDTNKIHIQCVEECLKHMIDMRCVDNMVSMFSAFSASSNLYECQNVRTADEFWRLLNARMNPIIYRKRTAAPKAQTVERMINKIGEKELEEIYKRETWDISDIRLKKWLYWKREEGMSSQSDDTLSIGQLRAKAKTKKCVLKATNCFSNTSSRQTTYSLDDFKKFLTTLPVGADIQWCVSTYNKVTYGFPCNDVGRKPLKREGSWGMNTWAARFDINNMWVSIDVIGSHASTWKSSYPDPIKECGYGEGDHTSPILNNGIVIVVSKEERDKVSGYEWKLTGNLLFGEFFEGMYEYESIRGTYHNSTKLKTLVKNPYEGAFINRANNSQKEYFENGINDSEYGKVLKFKIDGVIYKVY